MQLNLKVNRKIALNIWEKGDGCTIYSIQFEDEPCTELDLFFSKFEKVKKFEPYLNRVIAQLNVIATDGANPELFRPEGDNRMALPISWSELRLYGFWLDETMIILGNGDIKKGDEESSAWQDDPIARLYLTHLNEVGRHVLARYKKGQLTYYENELFGDLNFEIEIPDLVDAEGIDLEEKEIEYLDSIRENN